MIIKGLHDTKPKLWFLKKCKYRYCLGYEYEPRKTLFWVHPLQNLCIRMRRISWLRDSRLHDALRDFNVGFFRTRMFWVVKINENMLHFRRVNWSK